MNAPILSPLVSVIVPVYNGGQSFRSCLASLKAAVPSPYEIIVVADGDTDGSWQVAQDFGAKVIRRPVSGGPARARNQGARAATGDILYFIDADVIIRHDAIAKVAKAYARDPDLAALIGSYDDAPGEANFLSQYKNLFHHYTHQQAREDASTFWGACGAIRRDIFLALGGFDERYRRPCIEDIELGYRIKAAGYKIRLVKELQVKHLKRWEPYSLLRAEIFYRALPWTALLLRDRRINNDLNLDWSSRISVLLTGMFLLFACGAGWEPKLLIAAAAILSVLLVINAPVYRFFWHKRGLVFALKVVPWHLFYYFYSGLAFTIGLVRHWSSQRGWRSGVLSQANSTH